MDRGKGEVSVDPARISLPEQGTYDGVRRPRSASPHAADCPLQGACRRLRQGQRLRGD